MAIPVFVLMTDGAHAPRRNKFADEAVIAASIVGVLFLFVGTTFFSWIGITENDFRIGGGIVLLAISVSYLVGTKASGTESEKEKDGTTGAVPLGIPLVMGPAAITTIILAVRAYGSWVTLAAVFLNLFIVWICFRNAEKLTRFVGLKNIKVVSKVASLLLVSMAVTMIRLGVKGSLGP